MVSIGAGDEVRRSPRNGHVSSSEGVRIGDLERLNAPIATMHPHEAAADSDRKLQQNFTWKDEAGPNATGLALPRRKDPECHDGVTEGASYLRRKRLERFDPASGHRLIKTSSASGRNIRRNNHHRTITRLSNKRTARFAGKRSKKGPKGSKRPADKPMEISGNVQFEETNNGNTKTFTMKGAGSVSNVRAGDGGIILVMCFSDEEI